MTGVPSGFSHLRVANRGEIACRVLRTARQLGLTTTAIYSEADARAPHVQAADQAVAIGPAAVAQSYLSIERVVEAAVRVGAEAIHPGYGLLSENAAFARACADAGLVFVGPSAESIELMGDKARARAAAEAAGVPCVPGYDGADPREEAFLAAAQRIGYPVMVKAAAGGGGRGVRRAADSRELRQALPLARGEAEAAFGDGRLLLERAIEGARHVEVQVIADAHGDVLHLGERDCSVQRRFQKVLEESPSPAVDGALRDRLTEAALALTSACDYLGVGTVELLLGPDGEFYFLEMPTRLQVEHPVTELVTGLDLVALQLRVAAGEPLGLSQAQVTMGGHAIEARLYAEDPADGFLPQTGRIVGLRLPPGAGLRVDHGLAEGLEVSAHYDPMLAKVIAHGADRAQALRRLARALEQTRVLGLRHNRDFLRRLLDEPAFVEATHHTAWLGRVQESALFAPSRPEPRDVAVAALLLLLEEAQGSRRLGEQLAFSNTRTVHYPFALQCAGERFELRLRPQHGGAVQVEIGDVQLQLALETEWNGRTLRVVVDGVGRSYDAHVCGDRVCLDRGIGFEFQDVTRAPPAAEAAEGSGRIVSPMDAAVVEVYVRPGDAVQPGALLVVLEAMKLQHRVVSDMDGYVRGVHVEAGAQVAIGQLLVEVAE